MASNFVTRITPRPSLGTGWSVVASGKLREYLEEREGTAPPLRAWASGTKERLVVFRIDEVSGLRIPAGRGNR